MRMKIKLLGQMLLQVFLCGETLLRSEIWEMVVVSSWIASDQRVMAKLQIDMVLTNANSSEKGIDCWEETFPLTKECFCLLLVRQNRQCPSYLVKLINVF